MALSKSKLKVLFVTCWYPIKERPGFGIFIKEHAKAVLQQPGIDLKVLQIWPVSSRRIYRREYRSFIDENGIETHQIIIYSFAHKLIYLWNGFMSRCAIQFVKRSWLSKWKPDLIHGNVVFQAGMIALRLARKWEIPFVISEHWSGLSWYVNTPYVLSKAGLSAYRHADRIFPVSKSLQKHIKKIADPVARMMVIPNVVDTSLFNYQAREENHPLKLLCVTSFEEVKERHKLPELLLEAVRLIELEGRGEYRISIVGGGIRLAAFKEEIEKYELQDIIECLGYLPKEQVAQLMKESDFLLHPTTGETFGVVVAEALCCGTPCVVSDVPALDELVDADSGIRVSENTAMAWCKALESLHELLPGFDRQTIAVRFGYKFSHEMVGKSIVAQYREILHL